MNKIKKILNSIICFLWRHDYKITDQDFLDALERYNRRMFSMMMTVKKQCCSLELAKRLKELGVLQDSLLYWEEIPETLRNKFVCNGVTIISTIHRLAFPPYDDLSRSINYWSAFNVAELGFMLPVIIESSEKFYHLSIDGDKFVYYEDMQNKFEIHYEEEKLDDTEADSRAKMVIHLIENDLLSKNWKETWITK